MNDLDLFAAAIAMTDPAERAALLDCECAGRPDLRNRLEQLVGAYSNSHPLLDHRAADETAAFDSSGTTTDPGASAVETPGTVIAGRYKLLQQIGEGGMGSVWMADQTEPVKRRVAVKLIRADRGQSRAILSRFDAERQAIALMDHPHIAKLLDAGTTAQGSPFFVMELVKGIPLNDYCDDHKLCVRDRLELFIEICLAVQHAHQKGIIHRDLKPTNILVESHDDKSVPRVIDFGLAKAVSGIQLSENTLFTAFGSVMGTPLYMAPEQADFGAVDVDTRADVYALGVILYELLTGTTPITPESIKQAALDEILRLVREQDARLPSSRLSAIEAAPSIAANRQTELRKLGRLIKGELDWIVMKALSKERERRYETANGFALDIERFLNNEPVTAGPPGASYRLRKFVKRHRGQAIAASLVLLTLLLGIVGTTFGLFEARRQERLAIIAEANTRDERDRAVKAEVETRDERDRARKAETQARTEADKSKAINNFLTTDLLTQAEPAKNADEDHVTLLQVLDRAADKVGERFHGQPDVEVALRDSIAETYHGLASWDKAERQQRALLDLARRPGAEPAELYRAESGLADVLIHRGRADDEVLTLARSAWDGLKRVLGADHSDTLGSMNILALAYRDAGKLDLALPLSEELLRLRKSRFGLEHPETLSSMNNLGRAFHAAGKLDLALPLFEEALKLEKAVLGPDHPGTLSTMDNLAGAYHDLRKMDLAIALSEETLRLRKAKLGPEHHATLTSMNDLAVAYRDAGKPDLAVPLFAETLGLLKTTLGPHHPDTLVSMNNLAMAYLSTGKLDLAVPLLEETLRLVKARLGPEHLNTISTMNSLAVAYTSAGRLDLTIPLHEEALKILKAKFGSEHPDTIQTNNSLKFVRNLLGAEDFYRAKLAELGPSHTATLLARRNLAQMYMATGRLDEAEAALVEVLKGMSGRAADDEIVVFTTGLMNRCLTVRENRNPDDWRTFYTRSLLGGVFVGQKRYAEAESLLLKGYKGLKEREQSIPPQGATRIPEALDRLIELFIATNKPDEVKKWQAERARYSQAKPDEKK